MRTFPIALAFLFAAGCERGRPCEQNLHCEMEEVCRESRCVRRACMSSADCPAQQYCDDERGVCIEGCQVNGDCLPDQICDNGACQKAPCRDTNLDCAAGEFCNGITGECFPAGGPYCQPCEDAEDCGGGANFCFTIGGAGPYCGVDCASGQECPRAYDCVEIMDLGGNVIGRNCVTPCWIFE